MGADLCSNNLFDFDEEFPNEEKKIIKKQDKIIKEEIPETIQENISIYSNPDVNERSNNNQKYYRNYDDINNLKSSIFENEENDHIKKYEQEINAEEHPYIFSSNYNLNKEQKENRNENNLKNYTFKNSASNVDNIQNNNNSNSNKNIDFNNTNEFILNNKRSFKNMEELRSKKNIVVNNDAFISFGNVESRRSDDNKKQNETNEYNNTNKENENKNVINDININFKKK